MADKFGANPDLAGRISKELGEIRDDMSSMGKTFERYDQATRSSSIEDALTDFYDDSSDNRDKLDKLLKRASGMLHGLAKGTHSVDAGLAKSLDQHHGHSAHRPPEHHGGSG